MKAKLETVYSWQGRWYVPGEVEIPDQLAVVLGMSPSVQPESASVTEAVADADDLLSDSPKRPGRRKG